MEIVINNKTYVLKPVNADRRVLFSTCVLPFYDKETLTNEQSKEFEKNVTLVLWDFLKDEDKKEIGVKENFEIEIEELGKFINWVSEKIKEYCDFIKLNNGEESSSTEKTETIFAFIAKQYGWTFDYIREMDEIELYKSLKEACSLANKENTVNIGALVGAFSAGSKQAKRKIDEMNSEAKIERKINDMKGKKAVHDGDFLSDEQLKSL